MRAERAPHPTGTRVVRVCEPAPPCALGPRCGSFCGLRLAPDTMARMCPMLLTALAFIAIFMLSALRPTSPASTPRRLTAPSLSRSLATEAPRAGVPTPATLPAEAARAVPPTVRVAAKERPEVAWLRGGPTPVADVRRAAKTYFADMFNGRASALPAKFDAGVNPCWGGAHCLPAFLILGVYQSGVRDLYSRLQKHPGVAHRPANSPSFYSQVHPTWTEYVQSLRASSAEALGGKLLGEASAVTFHFVWVHQVQHDARASPPTTPHPWSPRCAHHPLAHRPLPGRRR
jgi:hypothetical protein